MPPLSLAPSDSRIGNSAASVLPDPVGATTRRCEPARISDIACACISLIFEISARWSNWASPVLPDLLRSFVSNHASDRTRAIKTVRRVRRTERRTLACVRDKVRTRPMKVHQRLQSANLRREDYRLNCDSMRSRVPWSGPSVFQSVTAYCFPSVPTRRRSIQDCRRPKLLFFTTRKSFGRSSQYCRTPRDLSFLSRTSFAAAVGRPKGVSSPLSSLQGSISRTSTILLFVTKSLRDACPPNPENMILGRNLRQGDDTFASHPVVTLKISSPASVISPPASE